ncbi:helix-turn-helix transcriptional regulator [Bradyrhizobium sp. RT6a]|uniref:helix-turn-helix domain-containing protein n=1 Tax=unclassified Bradyrhizobium TaxID=2631580 RepID=UPI00339A5B2C
MSITPQQCRAARGLLDWTQSDLAKAAAVGLSTVKDFERGTRETDPANVAAMEAALERAGIEFLPARSGKGAGLRYAKHQ